MRLVERWRMGHIIVTLVRSVVNKQMLLGHSNGHFVRPRTPRPRRVEHGEAQKFCIGVEEEGHSGCL